MERIPQKLVERRRPRLRPLQRVTQPPRDCASCRGMQASFVRQGSAGIIKARAVESRLMSETWAAPEYNLLPRLKGLRIPTLVITADHEFIPISAAEHIAQAIPNARMVTL